VLLQPADLDESVAFYEEGIGLVRFREWGGAGGRGVVYFLGGGYLELTEVPGGGPAPLGVRLWLQVADAAAAAAELADRGITVAAAPELKPWGLIELSVVDPDGLELVIIETPLDHPLRRRGSSGPAGMS
jgi:catechol 2,3-dioxygenase-like lactoylglutathione lyase family enzyme